MKNVIFLGMIINLFLIGFGNASSKNTNNCGLKVKTGLIYCYELLSYNKNPVIIFNNLTFSDEDINMDIKYSSFNVIKEKILKNIKYNNNFVIKATVLEKNNYKIITRETTTIKEDDIDSLYNNFNKPISSYNDNIPYGDRSINDSSLHTSIDLYWSLYVLSGNSIEKLKIEKSKSLESFLLNIQIQYEKRNEMILELLKNQEEILNKIQQKRLSILENTPNFSSINECPLYINTPFIVENMESCYNILTSNGLSEEDLKYLKIVDLKYNNQLYIVNYLSEISSDYKDHLENYKTEQERIKVEKKRLEENNKLLEKLENDLNLK